MLDEVTADMRLEYPDQRQYHADSAYRGSAIHPAPVPSRVK